VRLDKIVLGSRDELRKELERRYEDLKERLVGQDDPVVRGRAQMLKDMIQELKPLITPDQP
jgi:hypothetical protein